MKGKYFFPQEKACCSVRVRGLVLNYRGLKLHSARQNWSQVYLIYWSTFVFLWEQSIICPLSGFVICQVVDTPYLVNPEWKNFIPGYMYNDSDLELTAESLYRQDKLMFMYSDDSVLSATFEKQCFSDDYSPHSPLHICLLCILYLHLVGWISQQDKSFIQLQAEELLAGAVFDVFFSVCLVGSGISHPTEYFISNDEDANERKRDAINPEKLISIIFLGYVCCFSSACFSVITSSFIISPHWEAAYPQLLGWQARGHYISKYSNVALTSLGPLKSKQC